MATWCGLLFLAGCSSTGGGGGLLDGGVDGATGGFGNLGGSGGTGTGATGGVGGFGATGGLGGTGATGGVGGTGATGGTGGTGATGGTGGTGGTGATGGSGGTGGCVYFTDCDDGTGCTTDACESGQCTHTTIPLDDGNPCTTDACDPINGVTHNPANIDDNDACTTDVCSASTGGITHTPISCDDANPCTADSCNTTTGCVNTPISGTGVTLFSEDFSDNSAGWTLDTEWQIGPAVAGCTSGADPATDATSGTSDNGIAGMVIGGCYSTSQHSYYYLTSPVINAGSAPALFVSFMRWLNSDYTSYVNNTVEVYNGSTWVQVWQSGPSPGVHDTSWTPSMYDVSSYKNANFRVRFGMMTGPSGVISYGGWNVDDVKVATGNGCP
jgi:Dictyostelium (slime mold) repeat